MSKSQYIYLALSCAAILEMKQKEKYAPCIYTYQNMPPYFEPSGKY